MIQDDVVPALISEDGRWWWDGARWRPRTVEGKLDLFWFTSTPDWVSRVLVTGLIGLIPIVGSINLLGWTLEAADMIRAGWKELPPPGFQYLSRGVAPFVVALVYGVLLFFVLGTMAVFVVVLATSGNSRLLVPAIGLGFLVMLILLAWWLASLYLLAAVLLASDRLGIAKAIDPRRLFGLARANHEVSLHVALVYGAATIVIAGISVAIGVIIPFSSLLISIGLPAVYAMIVPSLAAFRVEAPSSQLPPP
jgi:MFS family permease